MANNHMKQEDNHNAGKRNFENLNQFNPMDAMINQVFLIIYFYIQVFYF